MLYALFMKKFFLLLVLITILVAFFLYIINTKSPVVSNLNIEGLRSTDGLSSVNIDIGHEVDITARFEIYTNGIKRVFNLPMYHGQSETVYIESSDSNLIYVKRSNTSWNDFFSTLPFSLSKECLITGNKEKFCNTDIRKLRFFLNGAEFFDILDNEIMDNDVLEIIYGT